MSDKDILIFNESPVLRFAGSTFVNVPVPLQYEDTPLISVVRSMKAGFTTEFPIYGPDGVYLAKLVGSRLHRTKEGEKAGLKESHPDKMTVLEMGGKTILEITRTGAAALKTEAEIYAPDGALIKVNQTFATILKTAGSAQAFTAPNGSTVSGNFNGVPIGILVRKDGTLAIGVMRWPLS